ncbi:MAG: hypothetical protein P0S96_08230 [Simkaniaceae bacterium]|nr:hypothetical protein [Candidatus Sacchlamyda saccharinae]
MRLLFTLFTLASFGGGLYWLADKNPDLKQKAEEFIDFRTTTALETRFDSMQVMEMHQKKLLREKGARYLDPELKFFPFLLMEVKYLDAKNRTKESLILWDLTDGEMVLDTKNWEKTHGFADCILSRATPQELKILHTLGSNTTTAENLEAKLALEAPILNVLLHSCERKNLIIQTDSNGYRLHMENPKLTSEPKTNLHEQLTTRAHKKATRAKSHFKSSSVERLVKMAFGETFSIRTKSEIYLPIHRIVVQNPDGSIQTSHFNGLTGKELPSARFYQ